MKIKTVCEQTGLTDRAVRFYIEEGLISPDYTESYIGRKAFDFSEEDVKALQGIALLRVYGYSVLEIAQMQREPEAISVITQTLITRTEESAKAKQEALLVLKTLKLGEIRDVPELVASLATPSVKPSELREDGAVWYRVFWAGCSAVAAMLCALLPIFVALIMLLLNAHEYHFPKINVLSVGIVLLLLIPSLVLLLIRKKKSNRVLRIVLTVFCLICAFMIQFFGLFSVESSTTDGLMNYRVLDMGCDAATDAAFQTLFPGDVALWMMPGSRYYYSYAPTVFGESDNIYAEWQIKDDEAFEREVRRVQELFGEENFVQDRKQLSVQHGSYRCLFLYEDTWPYEGAKPFAESEHMYYRYYLFAYDEGTNTVRYYYGHSRDGGDPPYYLSLPWD